MTILELLIHCNNHDVNECPKLIKYNGYTYRRFDDEHERQYVYLNNDRNNYSLISDLNCEFELRETFEIIEPAVEKQEPELIPLFDLDDYYGYREICERINEVIDKVNKIETSFYQ